MAVTYQTETFNQYYADASESLLAIHYEQLAGDKDAIPLDPDVDKYNEIEALGRLLVVTARKDGKLIGYHLLFIDTHLHYKTTLHAFTDIYYLAKEHRTGRTGYRLFTEVEKILREKGVVKWATGTKIHEDHTRLFEALGFTCNEKSFKKILK